MKPAPENIASRASKSNDGRKIVRSRNVAPRLAADVVGAAARSPGPLAARRRDRRYRPRPGAGRALERPDQRRAYFFGGAAHAFGRGRDARADAARGCPIEARGTAARCAGICHRRHDLAVQGGAWRRLQGGGKTAACGDSYPLRTAAGAFGRDRAADQGSRQRRGLSRGHGTCRVCASRSEAPVRARSRSADFDPAGLPDTLDRGQCRKAVPGALQGADCVALAAETMVGTTRNAPLPSLRLHHIIAKTRRNAMIHVCSLAALPETVKATGASHILTVMANVDQVQRPESVLEANHLKVQVDDITEQMDGFVAPSDRHIEQVLNFVRGWDRSAPLVVHCYAGISRSTASAFAAACLLNPHRDEISIARQIRAASPIASPNRLIVSLADRALGREGRMLRALDEMGPGSMMVEGRPFRIDLD